MIPRLERIRRSDRSHSRLPAAFLFLGLAFGAALATADGPCAPFTFLPPLRFPLTTSLGIESALGDFDGDGRTDVAMRDRATHVLAVVYGEGGGAFSAPRQVSEGGPLLNRLPALHAADLNADGRADLVAETADGFRVFLGRADRTFAPGQTVTLAGAATAAVGDFDDDGRLDVVLGSTTPSLVWTAHFFRGNGSGGFAPGVVASAGEFVHFFSSAAGDFNGDGKLDLVVAADYWRDSSLLLLGDGSGQFTLGGRRNLGLGLPQLHVADLDGDGISDFLVGGQGFSGNGAYTYFGSPSGTLSSRSLWPAPFRPVFAGAAVADLDRDGRLDAVVASSYRSEPSHLLFFKGRDSGEMAYVSSLHLEDPGVVLLGTADVDGDGRLDLLTASNGDGRLGVFLGSCGDARRTLTSPAVVSVAGVGGARYESDLTLVNGSGSDALVELVFQPSFGGTAAAASLLLPAGRQRYEKSARDFLGALDMGQPYRSDFGGTLGLRVGGASPGGVELLVRTTAATPTGLVSGVGYGAVESPALHRAAVVPLLEDGANRTNLVAFAAVAASGAAPREATVHVTLVSTDPERPGSLALDPVPLAPGAMKQWNRALRLLPGAPRSGFARLDASEESPPVGAYAMLHAEATSDPSLLPALGLGRRFGVTRLVFPSLVEAGAFTTELLLVNASNVPKGLRLRWVAEALTTPDRTATLALTVPARGQILLADVVQAFRELSVPGVGPRGPAFVGALFLDLLDGDDADGLVAGARVSSVASNGAGPFGVFLPALGPSELAAGSAGVLGLRQDERVRSNLALVNAGEEGEDVFRIDVYAGDTGVLTGRRNGVRVAAGRWMQLDAILSEMAPGAKHGRAVVTRVSGTGPFLAYGVLNEGAWAGAGSGDGTYLPMVVSAP